MGRHKKIDPHEVLEKIDGTNATKKELARKFDVCPETIANYIKTLVLEGKRIIYGPDGYVAINKEWVDDPLNADQLKVFQELGWSIFKTWTEWMTPLKPMLPHMRKVLRENTTPEERRQMLAISAKWTALLAIASESDESEPS